MRRWIVSLLCVIGATVSLAETTEPEEERKVTEQVVFFYYSDLAEVAEFYETIMGFKETFALDWVKIYQTTGNSSIGIVDEKKGFLKGATEKPVMLSFVTDDVDRWYRYLEGKGVKILSVPADNTETRIRAFVFKDPGGYSLEFFEWLDR